jgi:DNA invertase Pin-like site-specific DNA recombinase
VTSAREYLRVSLDRSGRERSIVEQQSENRAAWPDVTFGEPYSDVSISASRYTAKARGGYTELTGDLEAGRFGADLLVLWESSRGSRRVSEWVSLIEVCDATGVKIAVTTHDRTYDPGNAHDRKALIDDANDAEYESAKLRARALRANAANAAAGKPHGRVPFGYKRTRNPETGRIDGQVIVPDEAEVVRELFARLTQGHSLRAIAADFADRGVRTRPRRSKAGVTLPARPWTAQHLRSLATNDLYRGKRIHHGELVDGTWEPIVTEAEFLAVHRLLTDPARRTTRPGRARHLLSMIGRCDVCGGPLASTSRRGMGEYYCHRGGHVRVLEADLDGLAEAVMVGYLARPDNVARLTADEGGDDALADARDEVARIRAELEDLGDKVGRGDLSATLAARAEPAIQARLAAAEDHAAELATPSILRGLIAPGIDVARRWAAAPMSARRDVARILLAPDVVGELRVTRAPKPGHRSPVHERVTFATTER